MAFEIFTTEDDGRFFAEVYETQPDRGVSDDQEPVYVTGFYDTEEEARLDALAARTDQAFAGFRRAE